MVNNIRSQMVELLPRLRRFTYALTGDLEQADDLVQDTCTRALSNLSLWQPGTRLDSWMYRIAQNLWFDKMRAKKSRGEVLDIEAYENLSGSDGRQVTESSLTLARVSHDISRLPRDQQLLIGLICIDGLSYREAAETLGIPIGTVMSRLARARQSLHHSLESPPDMSSIDPTKKSEGPLARNLR